MRIAHNDPHRLVLTDRTWWISVVCFLAAAVLVANVLIRREGEEQYAGAALFAFAGLFLLRATDVVFDKASRTCAVRRLDVFRWRKTLLNFGEITDVRVESAPMQTSVGAQYRLSLITYSGPIRLTATYAPGAGRYDAMRTAILDALFQSQPHPAQTDPIAGLLAEGRVIDAVALLREREGLDLTTARTRVAELQTRRAAG